MLERLCLGGKGVACAEIVERAIKPAQVAMMMMRINRLLLDQTQRPHVGRKR